MVFVRFNKCNILIQKSASGRDIGVSFRYGQG